MDVPLTIPDLGEIIETVKLVRWLKQAGEAVALDEAILEITTDKIDVVIQSPATGILTHLGAAPGEKVVVGAVVGTIRADPS